MCVAQEVWPDRYLLKQTDSIKLSLLLIFLLNLVEGHLQEVKFFEFKKRETLYLNLQEKCQKFYNCLGFKMWF